MVLCAFYNGRCGGERVTCRSSNEQDDCGKQKRHVCKLGRVGIKVTEQAERKAATEK